MVSQTAACYTSQSSHLSCSEKSLRCGAFSSGFDSISHDGSYTCFVYFKFVIYRYVLVYDIREAFNVCAFTSFSKSLLLVIVVSSLHFLVIISSMIMLNRVGLKLSPCLIPVVKGILSDNLSAIFMDVCYWCLAC